MIFINQNLNLFSFSEIKGDGWAGISVEDFNSLRAQGFNPNDYNLYRVSKDTIWNRIRASNKTTEAMNVINSLTPEQRFDYEQNSWFWNNNSQVIAMLVGIGVNPSEILAPDPYL